MEKDKLATRQTVLVIGGTGFIGLHTVRELAAHGHAVYATHSRTRTPAAAPGVTWIPCDLGVGRITDTWPRDYHSILFLAQSRAWRDFPAKAADVFQVNVASAFHAVELARQVRAQRFIYASTGSIYSQTAQPARENEPLQLAASRSFYVASKLATELLLQAYGAQVPVVVLRLFVPYGAGQNPDMLMPRLVRQVRERLPITLHGADGLRCNPVAVGDVARVLRACLELRVSATLNVAGPDVLTLRQIGAQIGQALDCPPRFEVRPAEVPPVIVGDTTALQAALGWAPAMHFETGLRAWLGSCPAPLAI
ncbi:MAG TPA: NAD(P)-dependent oxidoreductase [Gemmataceae bacterium]|nr:NAD(P)-dependent oxidoreductase [Gemmataceae bacterium]